MLQVLDCLMFQGRSSPHGNKFLPRGHAAVGVPVRRILNYQVSLLVCSVHEWSLGLIHQSCATRLYPRPTDDTTQASFQGNKFSFSGAPSASTRKGAGKPRPFPTTFVASLVFLLGSLALDAWVCRMPRLGVLPRGWRMYVVGTHNTEHITCRLVGVRKAQKSWRKYET